MLTVAAVLVIVGGSMGYKIISVEATAGQILKIVTSDGGNTFYIGRCFRTDIKVQTDNLNANSVDVIIPYNPSYIRPYTGSGCTIAATAIQTDGLFGSYPSNSIAGNEINVTAYDPTGITPVNTGSAPTDRLLGHVYWKVLAASGSYYLPFQFTPGSTIDTNMAQQNGNGTDVLDAVENLIVALAPDTTGPTFTNLSPANGATNVSLTTSVTYTFSDAGAGVNTGTLVHSLNRVSKPMTFSACTLTNSNRIPSCNVTMSNVGTLLYNMTYRVHGTGSDLASPSANSSHQVWTFSTEDDTDAPYLQNLSPSSGQTGVAVNSTIVMHLKDYKNNAGVTPGLGVDISTVQITVTPAGGSAITYNVSSPEFSYTGTTADYTITIDPATNFVQNNVISIAVQASDLHIAPNVMSTYAYSFTTADTTAPSISGRNPDASATGVATTANIVFHATDNGAGVDIGNTTVTVNGAVYTSASPQFTYTGTSADYTVTINPTADFTDNTVVAVTIATRDLASTPNTTSVTYGFLVGTDGRNIAAATTTSCTTSTDSASTGGNSRHTTTVLESITTEQIPLIIFRRHLPGTDTTITEQLSPDDARRVSVCYVDDGPTHTAAPRKTSYTDVPWGSWYEDALKAFLDKGILDATQARFRGNDTAKRAEFAKVLGKLNGGAPEIVTPPLQFDDVAVPSWYAVFVEYAGQKGWMRGYNNCIGSHPCIVKPGSTISRAEAAAMIVRYFGLASLGAAPRFADVHAGEWYVSDIAIAADRCIVQGSGLTHLANPNQLLNRAEMIVMLDRAQRNLFYGTDCRQGTSLSSSAHSVSSLAHSSSVSQSSSSSISLSSSTASTSQKSASLPSFSSSEKVSRAASSMTLHPAAPDAKKPHPPRKSGFGIILMFIVALLTFVFATRFFRSPKIRDAESVCAKTEKDV